MVQAVAISGDGTAMERDHAHEARTHRADLPDPATVGTRAGNRAAAMGQDALNWGSILGMVLYILAVCFMIAFGVNLFGLGKRNGNSSPGAAGLCLLAAVACASAPTVLGLTSQTITGAAPSITGSGTAPVQF